MTKQEFKELTGENPEDILGNDYEDEISCCEECGGTSNGEGKYEDEDGNIVVCSNCWAEYDDSERLDPDR